MSQAIALETRLDAVEKDLAQLKGIVLGNAGSRPWYERTVGTMKNYPEFAEVVRLGREMRKADAEIARTAE